MPEIRHPSFLSMRRIFTYKTEEKYVGRPIKDVLKNKYKMSSALISDLKNTEDGIMVGDEKRFVNYILKKDDILKVTIKEEASENIEPVFGELDVLYEDKDILAVNKPSDMPTHTSHGHHRDTLSNAVLYYLNKNGEEHTFHAITRLDKNTSGVVLIAKNRYAHDLFSNLLRRGALEKTYTAVVTGELRGEGMIDKKIRREGDSIIKRVVADDGKEAVTEYCVISNHKDYSYVELKPKTGRTHQLRVHMSYIGHPLLGDNLYGGDMSTKRHLLHCKSISFIHPITNEKMKIEAPIPNDILRLLH